MTRLTLVLFAFVLLSVPLTAPASTSAYWELWRPTDRNWAPYPTAPPTDGTKAKLDSAGNKLCAGELRRYVQRTHQSEQGQVQIRVKYTYYCRRLKGAPELKLTPEQAPDCGPTVSAD